MTFSDSDDVTSARSLCRPFVTTPNRAEASVADPTFAAATKTEKNWQSERDRR